MGPVAPALTGGSVQTPFVLSVGDDGSVTFVTPSTDEALLARPADPSQPTQPSPALTRKVTVDGDVGAKLTCGRFVVTIPPGAVRGSGTVTATMPDSCVAVVDLTISPPSLNGFATPVQLSYDNRGLTLLQPLTIYYWNGTTWVDLGVSPQAGTGFPTADLMHFSKYSAGKAGW